MLTARATEEISTQIGDIQGSTAEAVSTIQAIGKTVNELSEVANGIAAAVEEQAAATGEVASNTSGVSEAAEQAGHIASDILGAVNLLNDQSQHLTTEVDRFIG